MDPSLRQAHLPGRTGNQVNFGLEELTFKEGDIPTKAKEARTHVRRWAKADILGARKASWNNSTVDRDCRFPDPALKRANSKGFSIRPEIDPRAEVLPKRAPIAATSAGKFQFTKGKDKEEQTPSLATTTRFKVPVHPRLEGKAAWNNSTTLDKKQLKTLAKEELDRSRRLNSTKTVDAPTLLQRERQFMRTVREQKTEARGLEAPPEPITSHHIDYEALAASARDFEKENPYGIVFSQDWKKKEYQHVGDWGWNEFENCQAWSCCMNSRFDSAGCCLRRTSTTAWNLTSF